MMDQSTASIGHIREGRIRVLAYLIAQALAALAGGARRSTSSASRATRTATFTGMLRPGWNFSHQITEKVEHGAEEGDGERDGAESATARWAWSVEVMTLARRTFARRTCAQDYGEVAQGRARGQHRHRITRRYTEPLPGVRTMRVPLQGLALLLHAVRLAGEARKTARHLTSHNSAGDSIHVIDPATQKVVQVIQGAIEGRGPRHRFFGPMAGAFT